MTKIELINTVARNVHQTQEVSSEVIEEFLKLIGKSLSEGDLVKITNFGTFYPSVYDVHGYNNEPTNEKRVSARFRASTTLNEKITEDYPNL